MKRQGMAALLLTLCARTIAWSRARALRWSACALAVVIPLVIPLVIPACGQETTFSVDSPTPVPTEPPVVDPHGTAPDWSDCLESYQGFYYNLPDTHPDVEPNELELPVDTVPDDLDWWDSSYLSFVRTSSSLDFGTDWYPVDAGLAGDPAYFAVRWTGWIRALSNTTLTLSLGSADDSWVLIDNKVVASQPGIHGFAPATYDIPLAAKQYPLDVYFAQRAQPDSAFRLRIVAGDARVCGGVY